MKICIGPMKFTTQKSAKLFVKSIVESLIGYEVRESSEHFELLMGLWLRSPLFVHGVVHFIVAQKFSGAAMKAVTCEGQNIDWSIRSAISGKDTSRWTKLTQAMRESIRPQMQKFRNSGSGKCEMCDFNGFCEVDHVQPFKKLMRDYLDARGFFPGEYSYQHSGWCFRPEDQQFESNWIRFHQERCSLRLLCSSCHKVVTQRQRESESSSDA